MKAATDKEKSAVIELRSRGFEWADGMWNSKNTSTGSSLGYHHAAITALETVGFEFDGMGWIEPKHLPDDFKGKDAGLYWSIAAIVFIFGVIGFCFGGVK